MGVVNRIQNAWTRLQQFNPGTLQLIAADGSTVTLLGRGGGDRVMVLPQAATVMGSLVALALADQAITNTPSVVNFDTTLSDIGNVAIRSGGTFTILKDGLYTVIAGLNASQLQNNSILTTWGMQDGVAIPASSLISDMGNAGTSDSPLFALFLRPMQAGESFNIEAVTSVANGCRLDYVAAAPPAPAAPAARISITGFFGA